MSALGNTGQLPPHCSKWLVLYSNPLVTQLWCSPLCEQGPLKVRLLNKLPSSLSNSPLYIYGWANTSLVLSPVQSG